METKDTEGQSKRPPEDQEAAVAHWLKELEACRKREQKFRKEGKTILDLYENTDPSAQPFPILTSNTDTLFPALYSQVPRPVVQRRFKDADPLGKAASEAGKRMLEFLLDTNLEGYETYDQGISHAVLSALLPGRGWTCAKYDATFADDEETVLKWETVCSETKLWNRVYHGYATKWSAVPWIAYEEYLDRDECTRKFGDELATRLRYTDAITGKHDEKGDTQEKATGERKVTCVYQIWDKDGGRKIRYVSEQIKDTYLLVEDDPLELTGFFNTPEPLIFFQKPHSLIPTALYHIYENQAKELNKIQVRLNHLIDCAKARGFYDGELGDDLKKLFDTPEGGLVPTDKGASLAADKGLQNTVWFMPLDQIRVMINELYTARESCKQVIYEITGISDILRGATKASETLGAQEIKSQWGTLRLKRLQKAVQRYTRDLLRIYLEIAATKFSEETWAKATGLPFVTSAQRQQLEQVAMMAHQMQQPLDPQTQAKLQAPVWGQVLALLKNDLARAYRIDIETNSTVEPEAAEDQKQIAELMTAMGQYLNGVTPLVVSGALPFGAAQGMLLAISRRFRFGAEVEDYIQAMQPPKPPEDNNAEAQQAHMDSQAKMQQMQLQTTQQSNELALKQQVMDAEKQLLQKKVDLELRDIELQAREQACKHQEMMTNEKLAMRESTFQTKVSATDKVRSIKDASSKREEQVAKQADNKLATGVAAMQGTIEKMAEMQTQLVAHLQQQSKMQAEQMTQLMQAMTAPRKKRAIRGQDGRIEAVEESVA